MPAPRCCFDRILPRDLFRPQESMTPPGGRARAISVRGKTWINGSTLTCRFIGGNAAQRAKAKEQAGWWQAVANLKFEFGDAPNADIRISFDDNDGAWSYIGTDAKGIPSNVPTMNLGFLDGGTAAHEFGHAIGLAHEHSSPLGGIQWNEPVVLQALAGAPNFWDEATVRHNVFFKYATDQINGTAFDPDSIMLYAFPSEWTLNGVATHANEVLSSLDKTFIAGAKMYPRTQQPGTEAAVELAVGAPRIEAAIGKPGEEDIFRFDTGTDGVYVIETRGATDVYMKLFGPNSPTHLIDEDDDSGQGLNPRIAANLIKGRYYLQVRHYDRSNGTGKYTVGVARK